MKRLIAFLFTAFLLFSPAAPAAEIHDVCGDFGSLAYDLAVLRDGGIPLATVQDSIKAAGASPEVTAASIRLANLIYEYPEVTPEQARSDVIKACLTNSETSLETERG